MSKFDQSNAKSGIVN